MRTFTDAAKKLVLTTAFAALTVFSVSLGNCQAGGSFSVLSYNVDGLPQILQDGRFPGGNPALYTPYIGAKVIPYDIVNVQEDFNSHAAPVRCRHASLSHRDQRRRWHRLGP
jgi:hypothetical protein